MKLTYLLSLVTFLFISTHALASSLYICKNGGLERRIEVKYLEDGKKVPCEVRYTKENSDNAEAQTLWSAQAQEGYCEEKALNFSATLNGYGWNCSAD